MKRIVLFVLTNIAVIAVLSIVLSVTGVDRFLTAQGLNVGTAAVGVSEATAIVNETVSASIGGSSLSADSVTVEAIRVLPNGSNIVSLPTPGAMIEEVLGDLIDISRRDD